MKKTASNDDILYERKIEIGKKKLHYLKPSIQKKNISNLSIQEQVKFIEYGIAPLVPPKHKNILEAFEYWVSKTPKATAAIHLNNTIS